MKNLGLQNEFRKQELNSAQVQQTMQNWESLFWLPYELSGICPYQGIGTNMSEKSWTVFDSDYFMGYMFLCTISAFPVKS